MRSVKAKPKREPPSRGLQLRAMEETPTIRKRRNRNHRRVPFQMRTEAYLPIPRRDRERERETACAREREQREDESEGLADKGRWSYFNRRVMPLSSAATGHVRAGDGKCSTNSTK